MTLSKIEIEIEKIQRFHDGELKEDSIVDLLNQSPQARVYLSALTELSLATKAAMDHAWEQAETKDAVSTWTTAAFEASQLVDYKLIDLAPLLERFHDDEVSEFESASVLALMQEREDIANYLENLDGLSQSLKNTLTSSIISKKISFDGFFNRISTELGFDDQNLEHAFSIEEHTVLLQRYFDDEVSKVEKQRVQSWIDAEQIEVIEMLAALEELKLTTTIVSEHASEKMDFTNFWSGIEEELNFSSVSSPIVSLGSFRAKKDAEKEKSFFQKYQQGIFTALAAVALISIFGPMWIQPNERVVERIVIVDGVSSASGTSVRIDAPVQTVSKEIEEDETTIIWITDESSPNTDVKEIEPAKKGSEKKEKFEDPI